MGIIRTVKGLFASDSRPVRLFTCGNCSNLFTKERVPPGEPDEVRCPNCGSTDVEVAVEA